MPGSACSSAPDGQRQDHRTTTIERHAIRRFGAGWFSYAMTIRIEEEMLRKLAFVADYEGRSINSHILVLVRESILAFEQEHGEITGTIQPAVNVKPPRKESSTGR